jgi:small neutral amino acid transporter SnatA (MarC family)
MTIYKGALIAGVIYLVLGVAFLLEALDLWAFELGDLRLVGPIALLLVGFGVAAGAIGRARRQTRELQDAERPSHGGERSVG